MIRRVLLLAGLISTAIAGGAGAASRADESAVRASPFQEGLVQLAQAREVEVFYDRYGREVLVDVYTGEVIAIREPRGSIRRFEEVRPREQRRQDRYYLDDPDDVARLRREQRRQELGRGYPPAERFPEYRDFRVLPD